MQFAHPVVGNRRYRQCVGRPPSWSPVGACRRLFRSGVGPLVLSRADVLLPAQPHRDRARAATRLYRAGRSGAGAESLLVLLPCLARLLPLRQ